MKSYPSSELKNVCDEQLPVAEPAEEGQDMLQQMLERRYQDTSCGKMPAWRMYMLKSLL